jgi:hypothetical protein
VWVNHDSYIHRYANLVFESGRNLRSLRFHAVCQITVLPDVCWRNTVLPVDVDGIVGFLNDGGVLISEKYSPTDCSGRQDDHVVGRAFR